MSRLTDITYARKIFILLILLISIVSSTIISLSESAEQDNCLIGKIYIPAVSDRGGGEAVETHIIVINGGGNIYLIGSSYYGLDTLLSLMIAYTYAYNLNNSFFASHDIYIILPIGTSSARGPSAGALFAYTLSSLALGGELFPETSGTGALNIDGVVENVGGVPEKISALRSTGVIREIFIPSSSIIYYNGSFLRKDLRIYPVSNIYDLINLIPANISVSEEKIYRHNLTLSSDKDLSDLDNYEKSLYGEYSFIKKIAYTYNISLSRDALYLEEIFNSTPRTPEYLYSRINTLFLLIVTAYRDVLTRIYYYNKDLFIEIYRYIMSSIRESRSYIYNYLLNLLNNSYRGDPVDPNKIISDLFFIKRSVELVDLYNRNMGFEDPNNININDLVYVFARSLSLKYWYDIAEKNYLLFSINSSSSVRRGLYLEESLIKKIYSSLNTTFAESEANRKLLDIVAYTNLSITQVSSDSLKYLKDLIKLINLVDILENYSTDLRYSSLQAAYLSRGDESLRDLLDLYNYTRGIQSYFASLELPSYIESMLVFSLYMINNYSVFGTPVYSSAIRVLAEIESMIFILDLLSETNKIPSIHIAKETEIPSSCSGIAKIPGVGSTMNPVINVGSRSPYKDLVIYTITLLIVVGSIAVVIISRRNL